MLRHWESRGLITPAGVDRFSGYRRYAPTQVGRVRAIAALRAVGETMDNIQHGPIAPLHLAGLQAHVTDESEIGTAVSQLLPRVRQQVAELAGDDAEIVLAYDGTAEDVIVVTAGTLRPADREDEDLSLEAVELSGAERGVTIRLDSPPASVADIWMVLDSHLAKHGLITTNVYRQLLAVDGTTTFQAPVRAV